jgi:hypothetical protein
MPNRFRGILLAMSVVLLLSSLGYAKKPMWLRFQGTAEDKGATYILRASQGGGAFEVSKKYVKRKGKSIYVRNGVEANILTTPAPSTPTTDTAQPQNPKAASDCHHQDDCPSKCCACIGLVRVCCGSGGTRGVCLGGWGCP